ncbi:MAG: cbb3-type cytochrome c oxidase subunit 3 [Candidatus Latescibacteria bacterium]|nr:cbb3-type cytochrome c oxidase subunit 3 [Candidatus Latescibacterota bacterium]
MYKEVLQSIEGVEIFSAVSMLIFLGFFVAMTAWFLRADKEQLKEAAALPLDRPKGGADHD